MADARWTERLFGSTRGRVIALLRRSRSTVNELAAELALTDNAVRAHLLALERDGLVEQRGVQRGVGKPAHVYALSADGEGLFPKAYGLVLRAMLVTLGERLPAASVDEIVAETGRRLAEGLPRASGSMEDRAAVAVAVLAELGGVARAEPDAGGGMRVLGDGCPLAQAVGGDGEVCRLAAALLQEVTGVPVREGCDRSGPPCCRFLLAAG
ncbi:MAG: putative transcriptional regulator [Gemmatimonadetes bacterium]|nr:putative transcriptional regulator [Gemmatimonadota bacterium]